MKKWLGYITLDRALIALGAITVVLGAIAYVVVFYGGGMYVVSSPLPTGTVTLGPATSTASSSATGTAFLDGGSSSSSASSTGAEGSGSSTGMLASYSGSYATPPVSWAEGFDTISVTGADLAGSQLTLHVAVQMGATAECVPMNVRLVTDEMGDLAAPITPAFTFGENGTCIGTPGAYYPGQDIVFTVDPTLMPLSFTSGGSSNKYFELSTTPSGGIIISPPPTRG